MTNDLLEYKKYPVLSNEAKKFIYGDHVSGEIPEKIKQELEQYLILTKDQSETNMAEMIKHFDEVFKNGPL